MRPHAKIYVPEEYEMMIQNSRKREPFSTTTVSFKAQEPNERNFYNIKIIIKEFVYFTAKIIYNYIDGTVPYTFKLCFARMFCQILSFILHFSQ